MNISFDMKIFKNFIIAAATFGAAIFFVACDDDDDFGNDAKNSW